MVSHCLQSWGQIKEWYLILTLEKHTDLQITLVPTLYSQPASAYLSLKTAHLNPCRTKSISLMEITSRVNQLALCFLGIQSPSPQK